MGGCVELNYTFQLGEQHQPHAGFKGVKAFLLAVAEMREAVALVLPLSGHQSSFAARAVTPCGKSALDIIDRYNRTGLGLDGEWD